MSPKLSARAAARAIYRAAPEISAPPVTPPRSLTDEARHLYENTIVPVREIARLAGVSEPTIYKYVRRGGWKRRNEALAASLRRAKGAGGRYIRREDIGKPHLSGLAALDPERALRASQAMREAGDRARVAERRGEAEMAARRATRIHDILCGALAELAAQQSDDPRHAKAADSAARLLFRQMQAAAGPDGERKGA
jgi:hypothetical protein